MSTKPRPMVEKLLHFECFWRDHQRWLAAAGYMLRPRYMPDWVPSWLTKDVRWIHCEDSVVPLDGHLMDATRISDGKTVALKCLNVTVHPYEVEIAQMLGASNLFHHPHNHSVPLYDVLFPPDDPNLAILVIPFLRWYDDPKFDTIGEIVQFFHEIFEGLQFMHSLHIAHRDINSTNIMMDASSMYPEGFHPLAPTRKPDYTFSAKHYTRTKRPPKYYIIDFGLSCRYDPANGPPQDYPIRGGDKSVPEFQGAGIYRLYNPFPTDVYYLGSMIRKDFLVGDMAHKPILGLDFMKPLIEDMTQDDPTKRPTMEEVVARFEIILRSLSSWTLRSRVAFGPHEYAIVGCYHAVPHWIRRIKYILRRYPALPSP